MKGYALFDTAIGPCAVAWTEDGISHVQLPEKDAHATERMIAERSGFSRQEAPAPVQEAIMLMRRLLIRGEADLSRIPLDLDGIPQFHRKVYKAARRIPAGEIRTYGDLAREAGSPGAARAAGQAMAKNPLPLIVPCHRVLASGGKLCGFSAYGGVDVKKNLLAIEGAGPEQPVIDPERAAAFLKKKDRTMAALINAVGPLTLRPLEGRGPFESLVEAVVYQQLTGKAAATILARVKALFPEKDFPSPEDLLAISEEELRGAGLSRAKAASLKDIASKTIDGLVPAARTAARLDDEEIIRRLTAVRGVGRWTVEMYLIFVLGRPDVLPSDDYGVRKGFAHVYRRKSLPAPKDLEAFGERWRPYRTAASWYLWRALDTQGREIVMPLKTG
jgi:methylated-DNA-[protein]-cysteine S-methyltransferase